MRSASTSHDMEFTDTKQTRKWVHNVTITHYISVEVSFDLNKAVSEHLAEE